MTSCITDVTSYATIGMFATMTLSTILYEFEIVFLAKSTNFIGICITTIKVYNNDSLGLVRNSGFYDIIVDFKSIRIRFDIHRNEIILSNSEGSCNIGICWYDHLISWLHYPHFNVCTKNPNQCIQTISATNGMPTTNKLGIMSFKLLVLFTLEIPTTIYNTSYSLINLCSMKRRYVLEG